MNCNAASVSHEKEINMKYHSGIHTKLLIGCILLPLISVVFVTLTMPARSCLRWSVFQAEKPMQFRYVIQVNSSHTSEMKTAAQPGAVPLFHATSDPSKGRLSGSRILGSSY